MKKVAVWAAFGVLLSGAGLGVAQELQSISASDKAEGAKANPQLLAEYGGLYPGKQATYVTGVGRRIAVQSGLSNSQSDFTIALLNSPVNNAFAIPGGYVYVTRQLMGLMNDEAELAGVLGHEVGHVAARHSAKRQAAAQRNSIFGALAQAAAGAFLGNSGFGELIGRGIGTGAQLLTLRYSRSQETEADALGIRYLVGAGYDPSAMSSVLASLQAQTNLDARAAGKSANALPAWASTHPEPGARVAQALNVAAKTGRAGQGNRSRDAFLAALDGAVYDDDPRQGIVDGRTFRHPDLRLRFTAPAGFALANGSDAVSISGSGGQGQFSGGRLGTGLDAYVAAVFAKLTGGQGVDASRVQRTRIAGFDAATATARANTQSGQVDVTVVAYQVSADSAYHFLLLTPAGSGLGPFSPMVQSFARLTEAEARAIRGRRIQVVTVGPRDNVASLSARMAYPDLKEERFRVLNALTSGEQVRAGAKVKLVVAG
ncbi:M48 family metalloprotease [Sphingomonas jatrophae]|uniref:Putative Zn-dependent protease n=1 Tax=Sphingomonas jatrophae TaxID=1166337 RepID=A0A1I6JTV3_9SPHN|nr:M48 family metalloprotease [Sphingomonas jatrophae]SFR81950.1 Putative Zn-dependent protease [Sphingomonas jatrophae]